MKTVRVFVTIGQLLVVFHAYEHVMSNSLIFLLDINYLTFRANLGTPLDFYGIRVGIITHGVAKKTEKSQGKCL